MRRSSLVRKITSYVSYPQPVYDTPGAPGFFIAIYFYVLFFLNTFFYLELESQHYYDAILEYE